MKFIVVLTLVLGSINAYSQGYEWEWSPRLPVQMPIRYVGVEVDVGYALHHADLLYSEVYLPCCRFTKGTGLNVGAMLYAEQWIKPTLAIHATAGLTYQTVGLTAGGDTLPRVGPDDVVRLVLTEWRLSIPTTYLTIGGGARMRLFGTHVSVGAQLQGSFLVGNNGATLTEHVVSPSDYYFIVQGRQTKDRPADSTTFAQRTSFVLEPALSVQYDLPMNRGLVLTPLLRVSMPITSLSSVSNWRYYGLTIGVRLSRGL